MVLKMNVSLSDMVNKAPNCLVWLCSALELSPCNQEVSGWYYS